DEVYRAPGQPRLRIALHYGELQTRRQASDGSVIIAGGEAVLCAARVEPQVQPGQIWATEEFRQQLTQRPSLWRNTSGRGAGGDERGAAIESTSRKRPNRTCGSDCTDSSSDSEARPRASSDVIVTGATAPS